MAFSEIEGAEILFFVMYVTERIYENSQENTTEVEYIDSVKYFEPTPLRTGLYYEIVIGYLKFARDSGYVLNRIYNCVFYVQIKLHLLCILCKTCSFEMRKLFTRNS